MENQNAEEIMAPDVAVPIKGGNEQVIVKEMNWKAAKLFLKSLAPHAEGFVNIDALGNASIDQPKRIPVLMTAVGEELLVAATGKPRDWVDALTSKDFFAVLQKAVELNLRPEMLTTVGKMIGQFRGLLPGLT